MNDQQLPGDEGSPEDERGCDVDLEGLYGSDRIGGVTRRTFSSGRRRLGRPRSQHALRRMGIKGAGTMNT